MSCGRRYPVNEPCQDAVTVFPTEKSPKGDAVPLKFQTRSGDVLRAGVFDSIARNLGTQLLLLIDATSSIHWRNDGRSITPERVIE